VCTHERMFMLACACVCERMYLSVLVRTFSVYVIMLACIRTYAHMYVFVYVFMLACTRTYAHTYVAKQHI
jgi:hypothetical protein